MNLDSEDFDYCSSKRIDLCQIKERPRINTKMLNSLVSDVKNKNCTASGHTSNLYEDMAPRSNVVEKQQLEKSSNKKKKPTQQIYTSPRGCYKEKVTNSRSLNQAHNLTSNSPSNYKLDTESSPSNYNSPSNYKLDTESSARKVYENTSTNIRYSVENSGSDIAELKNSKSKFKEDHIICLDNKKTLKIKSHPEKIASITITKEDNKNDNILICDVSEVGSQLLVTPDVSSDLTFASPDRESLNGCDLNHFNFSNNLASIQEQNFCTDENYIPPPKPVPPNAYETPIVFDAEPSLNSTQLSNFNLNKDQPLADLSENQSILPDKLDLQLCDVTPIASEEGKQKLDIETTTSSKIVEGNEDESTLSSEVNDELIEEIDDFLHELEFEKSMPKIYAEKILKDLKHFLRYYFKGNSVKLYGSYFCDVATTLSNINFALVTDHPIKNSYMLCIQKKLAAEFDGYKVFPLEEESNPRRSKICFVDKEYGISCDIIYLGSTVSQYLKLNGILRAVCDFNPRIKSLIIVTKLWAQALDIHESENGNLHPVGFSLLVVHYLQQLEKPLLPLLDVASTNWNLNKLPVKNNSSVADLWLDFLKYYGYEFNWIENVVTVIEKTPVSKSTKLWPISWIAIEDPVSNKNVAESVIKSDTAEFITSCFKKSYEYFIAGPYDSESSSSGSVKDDSQNIPKKQSFFKLSNCVSHPPPIFCSDDDDSDYETYLPKQVTVQEPLKFSKISEESLKCVDQALKEIYDEYKLSDKQVQGRKMFVQDLEKYIRRIYSGAKLRLFGSSVNGFGSKRSDLDICMTINGKHKKSDNVAHFLRKLVSHLRRKDELKNVFALYSAKIPIIKFNVISQNWNCDLSLNNVLAVHNSKLLHKYSLMDEKCRILGCTLKILAKKTLIADCSSKTLSSYSYILMVIYFLQRVNPPVLPVMPVHNKEDFENELDEKELERKGVLENSNHWFFEDAEQLKKRYLGNKRNTSSVGELWLQMLEFYLKLDYETAVNITEKDIVESKSLLRHARLFNIEDPFLSKRNLGCIVSDTKAKEIRNIFYRTRMLFGSDYLKNTTNLKEHYFSPSNLTGRLMKNIECTACGGFEHDAKECVKADPFKYKKKPWNPSKNGPNKSNQKIYAKP